MYFGLRSSCLSISPLPLVCSGSWTLLTVSAGDGVSEDLTIGGVEGLVGEASVLIVTLSVSWVLLFI